MIEGMQAEGVAACGKHFPGHGDTSQDSHHDLPRLPHGIERLEAVELRPFREASRAGVAAIMTAHVVFEAIDAQRPATMSRAVLTGLLREQIGFKGVIVSDDLGMKAVAAHYALQDVVTSGANAGVNLFLMAQDPAVQHQAIDALVKAVERGDVAHGVIEVANQRLDVLFQQFVKPPRRGPLSDVIGCATHQQLVRELGQTEAGIDPTAYEGNR
jgi:beta-N-acetylhexosaminidase